MKENKQTHTEIFNDSFKETTIKLYYELEPLFKCCTFLNEKESIEQISKELDEFVERTKREKELQKWGKKVTDSLYGFTKDDLEPLFEKYVLPIYRMCARKPDQESKWKIVNRETGEEYSLEIAEKELIGQELVNWKSYDKRTN